MRLLHSVRNDGDIWVIARHEAIHSVLTPNDCLRKLTNIFIFATMIVLLLNPLEEVKIMSEVKRRKGESFEAFFRRTKRLTQRSGKLLQARKIRFFEKTPGKNVQHDQALKRVKKTNEYEYLRKIGKLPDIKNGR